MTKNILLVFAGACCFGILSSFVKIAYTHGYTTAEVSGSQRFTGMIILWSLHLLANRRKGKVSYSDKERAGEKGSWYKILLTGIPMGVATYLYYISVKWIPASIAIILLMQFMWMGFLMEWLLFKKRPKKIH